MRGLILMLLVTLASLANAEQPQVLIDVQHDAHRQVTCWIIPGTGISCLPDSQLRQYTPAPDRSQDRPNPASAIALPQNDERFQL